MPNISSSLADLAIIRSLTLQRVSNGMSQDVANIYNDIIDDLTLSIKGADSDIIRKNLNATIRDLKAKITPDLDFVETDLKALSVNEATYTASSVNAVIGADIISKIPPQKTLERIYHTSLIEGATINDWYTSLTKSMQVDTERAVRKGVYLGETNHELSKRLGNVLGKTPRQSESITKTAVSTVTNQARQEVWESNEDIISNYEHLSVMDSRVSFICSSRDSATWGLDHKGTNALGKKYRYQVPPLHFNCRSLLIPILKSWEELNLGELSELPKGTKTSMDGEVSSGTSFNSWLKSKDEKFVTEYLGKGRADLYLSGKITLSDLVGQQGKTLTIAELKEKYG